MSDRFGVEMRPAELLSRHNVIAGKISVSSSETLIWVMTSLA